jgi:hypothetical protein
MGGGERHEKKGEVRLVDVSVLAALTLALRCTVSAASLVFVQNRRSFPYKGR